MRLSHWCDDAPDRKGSAGSRLEPALEDPRPGDSRKEGGNHYGLLTWIELLVCHRKMLSVEAAKTTLCMVTWYGIHRGVAEPGDLSGGL